MVNSVCKTWKIYIGPTETQKQKLRGHFIFGFCLVGISKTCMGYLMPKFKYFVYNSFFYIYYCFSDTSLTN